MRYYAAIPYCVCIHVFILFLLLLLSDVGFYTREIVGTKPIKIINLKYKNYDQFNKTLNIL